MDYQFAKLNCFKNKFRVLFDIFFYIQILLYAAAMEFSIS